MRRIIPAAITFLFGLIVLLSFIPLFGVLVPLRGVLINIAIIIAGMALLLGFVRLLNLHLRRVQQRRSGYSLVALIAAIGGFIILTVEQVLKLSGNQDAASLPASNLIF